MFFTLRYGEDDELLFNSNCSIKVLLENIKKRCKRAANEIIDLADDQAQVKNLSDQPDFKYASLLLQPRMTYILVKVNVFVDERTGDTHKTYTSLLDGLDDTNPEFLTRLANRRTLPDNGQKEPKDQQAVSRAATRTGRRKKGQLRAMGLLVSE